MKRRRIPVTVLGFERRLPFLRRVNASVDACFLSLFMTEKRRCRNMLSVVVVVEVNPIFLFLVLYELWLEMRLSPFHCLFCNSKCHHSFFRCSTLSHRHQGEANGHGGKRWKEKRKLHWYPERTSVRLKKKKKTNNMEFGVKIKR